MSLRESLQRRADLYALIRGFFAERAVLEVETPILSTAGNTEPNIDGFSTRFSGHVDAGSAERFLRTSPEYPLKRLLGAGVGDCYELGRVFRNGEAGRRHNPEFSMLEWYRVGWDHHQLIEETVALVRLVMQSCAHEITVKTVSYEELFMQTLGMNPFVAPLHELTGGLSDIAINGEDLSRDDWLDLLITHRIQPQFPRNHITVVHDFPASQAALARIREAEHPVAERFELYLGPYELANGYHELTDASEQRQRFEHDNQRREGRGQRALPIDERFLAMLEHGMPACSGVALGIERLLMCLSGEDDIRHVLAFAFAEA